MFDTTKTDLSVLLKDIHAGTIQLPEFQRNYVWNDADLRSLLASVLKGYPVGALLTLQAGGEVRFKPRLLEGVPPTSKTAETLLLDGQQRMTSLYQSTFSPLPVKTRTQKQVEVERYYYLDIGKALSPETDMEDAILSVPANRQINDVFGRTPPLDLTTEEREFEKDLFPLNKAFDAQGWLFGWQSYWNARHRADIIPVSAEFFGKVLMPFQRYEMPIIRLAKENSREAICTVFEKVNVGGKKLDAFELVTAIYAGDNFDLREDWDGRDPAKPGRRTRLVGTTIRRDVLAELASTDFLQACTLLHTRDRRLEKVKLGASPAELPAISCKRDALLALPLAAYRGKADAVQQGYIDAAAFLNELKIIWHKDVPYPPQLTALASALAILGRGADTIVAKEKLARWFWSIALGELYGSSTESRIAYDVPELVEWIGGGSEPRSLAEALFREERLLTLRSRLSAAYKAIHALLMRHGCKDFISGRSTEIMTFFNDRIDIHHIFPQAWCKRNKIPPSIFNSIINKTPLSRSSNIAISGDAPSTYLKRIQDKQRLDDAAMDAILRSHLIEPSFLRNNDFEGFMADRRARLARLVTGAMGKPIVTGQSASEREIDAPDESEIEENEALDDQSEAA